MTGSPSSDDPFGLCGQTIEGKYRVASVIGDGGFGVVYRAVHKGFGELIAVKCLKMPAALDDAQREALLETLRDEGRILHRLSRATSGIVQALDVGAFVTGAGMWVPYLVLEWLEGETLGQHLRGRSERGAAGMTVAEAIRLLEPAARALAVAHAHKVAHRDVKPANLFLTEVAGARTLKVLDFGIAKVLANHPTFTEALAATKQGPSAFTPRYGAPEQFNKARGATGPWTDVFALALIFVELVSGKRALDGDDPTQLYIASADPTLRPTLRAHGFDAGDAVERVLARALAIEPKHRYPSAGEFWDALVAAARGEAGAGAKAPPGEAGAGGRDGMLSTADFAAAKRLDLGAEASGGRGEPMDPTMPAESSDPAPGRPAVVKVTGNVTTPVEDSMVETIAPKRPPPAPRPAAGVAPDVAALPAAPAATPEAARPRRGGARTVVPWLLAAGVLAGGALAYFLVAAPSIKPAKPSAASASRGAAADAPAAPAPSASAEASASAASASAAPAANAPASASAAAPAAPPAPPPDMVYVPPLTATIGTLFEMREVTLTRGYFIDRHEVTVRAYRACMGQRMCSAADHVSLTPERPPGEQGAAPSPPEDVSEVETLSRRCNEPRKATMHPINCVDYVNAESYCRFRGRRLPTEAEWEIAARGTDARPYAWGDEAPTCDRACYDRNEACRPRGEDVATCASGSHPNDRTPEGVYDLAANVAEWVSDGLVFPPPRGVDPQGDPAAPLKVVRGASFLDSADKLFATNRTGAAPVTAHVSIGFRCAMDVPTQGEATPAP